MCRFIQGAAVRDPFVFYHWHYIDLFVYFSHHTVTIPPVVWTNAAHRNGVLMLGECGVGESVHEPGWAALKPLALMLLWA